MNSKKKHILKPGKHQFAPGSPAVHSNDNITDREAEWYLERYPHIASLFAPQPPKGGALKRRLEMKQTKIELQPEHLTSLLGDKEAT